VWNVKFPVTVLVHKKFNETDILSLFTNLVSLAFANESFYGKSVRNIHSFIHSFIQSFIHSLIHSFNDFTFHIKQSHRLQHEEYFG